MSKEYEIIGKDVYGTQAVAKNNTTNCSNCKYREFACGYVPCKDFFYLKDEELESRIKELQEKCKSEYQRGIEDGKIIAEHGTTMYQE